MQVDAALALLRACPGMLLVGVDPSSDELLLLSSRQRQAVSIADLEQVLASLVDGAGLGRRAPSDA